MTHDEPSYTHDSVDKGDKTVSLSTMSLMFSTRQLIDHCERNFSMQGRTELLWRHGTVQIPRHAVLAKSQATIRIWSSNTALCSVTT